MILGNAGLGIHQKWEAWMTLENPDMSMEDAVKKLKSLGNKIIEVDKENRRIKVMHEESAKIES